MQQLCAALPQYLIKLAEDYPAAKSKLYDAAEILGDGATQGDCFYSLYEVGDVFNEIDDTSWDISVGSSSLTFEIDLIEILGIAYDTPPETCYSIFENDDTLEPLFTTMSAGTLDILAHVSGGLAVTDNDGFSDTLSVDEGYLSVGDLNSGDVEMRNLVLRDTSSVTVTYDSTNYIIDTWNLTLIGPVVGRVTGSVATFGAGTVSFSLSAVYDGELYRVGGTNASAFTLEEVTGGWEIDGLELEFDDNGTTWALTNNSTLAFQ